MVSKISLADVGRDLLSGDAVAAIIELDDGRYAMQLRDDLPSVWYPGQWGCFGGALDAGEDCETALRRELFEELEFVPSSVEYFTSIEFDMTVLGQGSCRRAYYVVRATGAEFAGFVLHEGQEIAALTGSQILDEVRTTPYDAFALFLYHNRGRFRERDERGNSGANGSI